MSFLINSNAFSSTELLKRLEYTSSEEYFLEEDETKENVVNLNRRKSKMGRHSTKTSVKDTKRSKRYSYPDSKVNIDIKIDSKATKILQMLFLMIVDMIKMEQLGPWGALTPLTNPLQSCQI